METFSQMNTENSRLIQVIENINKELISSGLSDNIGLHGGTSGIALFMAYYDRIILKQKKVSQRVFNIMKHNIECIDSGNRQPSICSGISGFGWLCEHLRKLGMLNRVDIEFLDDLDIFLHRRMIHDIKARNYDFLHGAIGIGTYFLSRFDKKEVQAYLIVSK